MKTIKLDFTDEQEKVVKTCSLISFKTGMVDKCFELAEESKKFEEDNVPIGEVKEFYTKIKTLLVELFKQFTYEEMQEGVSQSEMLRCYNSIMESIGVKIAGKKQ